MGIPWSLHAPVFLLIQAPREKEPSILCLYSQHLAQQSIYTDKDKSIFPSGSKNSDPYRQRMNPTKPWHVQFYSIFNLAHWGSLWKNTIGSNSYLSSDTFPLLPPRLISSMMSKSLIELGLLSNVFFKMGSRSLPFILMPKLNRLFSFFHVSLPNLSTQRKNDTLRNHSTFYRLRWPSWSIDLCGVHRGIILIFRMLEDKEYIWSPALKTYLAYLGLENITITLTVI